MLIWRCLDIMCLLGMYWGRLFRYVHSCFIGCQGIYSVFLLILALIRHPVLSSNQTNQEIVMVSLFVGKLRGISTLDRFSAIQRKRTFITLCLLFCSPNPIEMGLFLRRRNASALGEEPLWQVRQKRFPQSCLICKSIHFLWRTLKALSLKYCLLATFSEK